MVAQVKIHEIGPGLLHLRLNTDPVCDGIATKGSICANAALCK